MTARKTCFVIAPMGRPNSGVRFWSTSLSKDVIEPAVKKRLRYDLTHARTLDDPGIITDQIIQNLVNADLVIADLSHKNANVFYELALRHALGKPFIQLVDEGQDIPFNVRGMRTIKVNINDEQSKQNAIEEIVKQVKTMEKLQRLVSTPISSAGFSPWNPHIQPDSEKGSQNVSSNFAEKKATPEEEAVHWQVMESAAPEELKPLVKELKDSKNESQKNSTAKVELLDDAADDLEAACALVDRVPEGGRLSATSSLQHRDADVRVNYRASINRALQRGITYRKIICSGPEQWPDRHQTWLEELTDKAELIRQGIIQPTSFQLLHYPAPMGIDVLISQQADISESDEEKGCLEMVAGFAEEEGLHSGFHTNNKRMVSKFLKIYVEGKIIAEAERHKERVLSGEKSCSCLEFLQLFQTAADEINQTQYAASVIQPGGEKTNKGSKRREEQ